MSFMPASTSLRLVSGNSAVGWIVVIQTGWYVDTPPEIRQAVISVVAMNFRTAPRVRFNWPPRLIYLPGFFQLAALETRLKVGGGFSSLLEREGWRTSSPYKPFDYL
jgi:hypothetical protein